MFTHLLKLIWNKKKQNFLLITEIFVAFIIIFAVFTLLVYDYKNYKEPTGFEYQDVWAVNFTTPDHLRTCSSDSVMLFSRTIKQLLLSFPQIMESSFSSENIPFSTTSDGSHIDYGNAGEQSNLYAVEPGYKKALTIRIKEGRWFEAADNAAASIPVVINSKLKEALFGSTEALGKIVTSNWDRPVKLKVIGVLDNVKDKGDYVPTDYNIYVKMDSGGLRNCRNILLKVQSDAGIAFESKLYKALAKSIGTSMEIVHLDRERAKINQISLVPLIILIVVAGFLIINVALGLFGVLWYNINKRKAEIGLRRAVGASGRSISAQLVGESLLLASLALILGSFFAIQFPILRVFNLAPRIYLIALLFSILFIYLLVVICSLYPGRQAAAIYPAVALHED